VPQRQLDASGLPANAARLRGNAASTRQRRRWPGHWPKMGVPPYHPGGGPGAASPPPPPPRAHARARTPRARRARVRWHWQAGAPRPPGASVRRARGGRQQMPLRQAPHAAASATVTMPVRNAGTVTLPGKAHASFPATGLHLAARGYSPCRGALALRRSTVELTPRPSEGALGSSQICTISTIFTWNVDVQDAVLRLPS
jgi:hypothetical protein